MTARARGPVRGATQWRMGVVRGTRSVHKEEYA